MGVPWILYDSILTRSNATISGSLDSANNPVANVADGLPWNKAIRTATTATNVTVVCDLGSGNSEKVFAFGIGGHNPSESGWTSFNVDHSDDNSTWTTILTSTTFDSDQGVWMERWTTDEGAHRYWRIRVIGTPMTGFSGQQKVGVLFLGRPLVFEDTSSIGMYMNEGFDPDSYSLRNSEVRSEGGNYLGTVVSHVRQSMSFEFGEPGVETAWTRESNTHPEPSWENFLRYAWSNGKPFFFSWDGDAEEDKSPFSPNIGDAWYCWPSANSRTSAPYLSPTRRRWRMNFEVWPEHMQKDSG